MSLDLFQNKSGFPPEMTLYPQYPLGNNKNIFVFHDCHISKSTQHYATSSQVHALATKVSLICACTVSLLKSYAGPSQTHHRCRLAIGSNTEKYQAPLLPSRTNQKAPSPAIA